MENKFQVTLYILVFMTGFGLIAAPVTADFFVSNQPGMNEKAWYPSASPSVSTYSWNGQISPVQPDMFTPSTLTYVNYAAIPSGTTPIVTQTFPIPSMPGRYCSW
jgi:hypothetical protein